MNIFRASIHRIRRHRCAGEEYPVETLDRATDDILKVIEDAINHAGQSGEIDTMLMRSRSAQRRAFDAAVAVGIAEGTAAHGAISAAQDDSGRRVEYQDLPVEVFCRIYAIERDRMASPAEALQRAHLAAKPFAKAYLLDIKDIVSER